MPRGVRVRVPPSPFKKEGVANATPFFLKKNSYTKLIETLNHPWLNLNTREKRYAVTLTIHTQEDDQRQLSLTVAVPEDRVKKAMLEKARKLSTKMNFPGFRRGKVPYQIIVKYLGEEAIRSEAVEEMVQELYKEAITQAQLEPYAPGQFNDMELEPLVLKFTVPLEPIVDLGNYRDLQKEVEEVEITEEALNEALERVQKRHQVLEPVERPAQPGDVVTLKGDGHVVVDNSDEPGETIFSEERIDFALIANEVYFGQAFVDEVVGLAAEESKTFTITIPMDAEPEHDHDHDHDHDHTETDMEPRQGQFTITVLEVKSRTLPELNDDLAREEGDYETLDELKAAVEDELRKAAEESAKNKMIDAMMDDLLAQASIIYPPAAIEMELDGMVEDLKSRVTRSGWQWEDYLKLQAGSEKLLRESWQTTAIEQVRRSLVLRQFVRQEKLQINPQELDEVFESRYGDLDESLKESMRRFFSESDSGFGMLSGDLLMTKVADRVLAIRSGKAPDLSDVVEAEGADLSEEE